MQTVRVSGGNRLFGEVGIGGSKNAALPILFGGILTGETCVFSNLPRVSDVLRTLEILRVLGARIRFFESGEVQVDYRHVEPKLPSVALTAEIRGSTYLLGALLGRFGRAALGGMGGCDFGVRPIDQHLMGFARLGATVSEGEGVMLSAPKGLSGVEICLKMPSVGATANLMLAATGAVGESVICNAAAEPHVAALADFLSSAGAQIEGVGTDRIRVTGGKPLHGVVYNMIPDMIEAGSYLCAAVACGGRVCVTAVEPTHLGALLQAFRRMGVLVEVGEDFVCVESLTPCCGISLETAPYPGFPTDLHPQMAALLCVGGRFCGEGAVRERIWSGRFRYVEGLRAFGADATVLGDTVVLKPASLHGACAAAPDLRGGAALLIAALAATGESEITGAAYIARGYEHLGEKLTALGAKVEIR